MNNEIYMLIHGILIGICLGYLIFRPHFKYNKSKMHLATKGIDKENKIILQQFINDCLDIKEQHIKTKGE